MDFEKLKNLSLKGFIADEEGLRLYELAREAARRGPCLEIGSYCGKSAAYLGLGCREADGTLYSLDHHEGSEEQQPGEEYFDQELYNKETGKIDTFPFFRKALRDLSLTETVVPIVSGSAVAARFWTTPLSLIFIDGGHTFESAFADYSSWVSHLLPGGYLLIHDIFPDRDSGGQAPRCIYLLALESGLFDELPQISSLGVLRRSAGATITATARQKWEEINR